MSAKRPGTDQRRAEAEQALDLLGSELRARMKELNGKAPEVLRAIAAEFAVIVLMVQPYKAIRTQVPRGLAPASVTKALNRDATWPSMIDRLRKRKDFEQLLEGSRPRWGKNAKKRQTPSRKRAA